jgi:hypothetical protein
VHVTEPTRLYLVLGTSLVDAGCLLRPRGAPFVRPRKGGREVVKLAYWVTKLRLPVVRSQLKERTFDFYRRTYPHVG